MSVLFPKWTKILDLSKELVKDSFTLFPQFTHVADIVATVSDSKKKKQTVIDFVPLISNDLWKKKTLQWIYLFTVDDRIVKIGGSRSGLKGRAGSYLCGHHIRERGKSGDCSKTNGYIYNTFDHYIRNGSVVKMYAFQIPDIKVNVDVWGKNLEISPQVYTSYETGALEAYKKDAGHYPCLSNNSDPAHR
jgi:hypothetical protein